MSKRKKMTIIAIAALAALLLLLGVLTSGITANRDGGEVTVSSGDGSIIVADKLKEEGLIQSPFLFRIVAEVEGRNGNWYPGSYKIPGGSSFFEICKIMGKPAGDIRVTFPEGIQVREMGTILEEAGVCKKSEFLKACKTHSFNYEFLKKVPASKRIGGLEGYLFPDTYYFTKDEDPDNIINTMLDHFQQTVYTPEILAKVKKSKYSLDQVIILASMVESEAATTEDRKTVAGVFLNRLRHPDKFPKLESCVTVEYAKGIKKDIISLADTKYNSKYNTYKYPGRPYGPICCPSMESINAVLTPTNNSYYYFQSDSKGRLHFARTWQEHAKIQKKLQSNWKTTKTRKVK